MITGRTPFPGATIADTFAAILRHEPRPVSDFVKDPPQKLVNVIERCLRKDPEQRYRSMASLLDDLQDLRLDLTLPTRAIQSPSERSGPGLKRLIGASAVVALLVLTTAGWWYFSTRHPPVVPGAMRNVPITSWSTVSTETVTSCSFSPDARMLAFASSKSGANEIWTKPIGGGDPIQVTKNGFYNQYPVWSPDGQEIAFFSARGGTSGIWKVAFTGGQESPLVNGVTQSVRPLRWLKNGRLIYVDDKEIYSLDVGSGERSILTSFRESGLVPRGIAVAPDGSSFAISVKEKDGNQWKVKTRRFDATAYTDIATSKDQIDSIVFHPNGADVYYTGSVDGTFQVFMTVAGEEPIQISSNNGDISLQDISADGTKVLYNTVSETSDLWEANTVDGKQTVVANEVSEEFWPDVSPDGRSVVYQSSLQPDHPFRGALIARPIANGPPTQVTTDGFYPVWSNDGQWIAFLRREDGGIGLWITRRMGTDMQKLPTTSATASAYVNPPYLKIGGKHISWSQDDRYIAYMSAPDGGSAVSVTAIDGSGSRQVAAGEDPAERLCCTFWSSDGKTMVFSSERRDPKTRERLSRIWSVNLDGGSKRLLYTSKSAIRYLGFDGRGDLVVAEKEDPLDTSSVPQVTLIELVRPDQPGSAQTVARIENAYFDNLRVSPNGGLLAFVTRSQDKTNLWTLNLSGGSPKEILSENDPKSLISSLAWTPDAQSIVFGKQTRTNLISMLTN
jgi:Tol biopolymer transport system component